MGTFEIESISELPSVKELNYKRNSKYATLPFIILAYYHRKGVDMLLVTDLTKNKESNYALRDSQKYPPHRYNIGNKVLDRSEVFYIGVAPKYGALIKKYLIDIPEFTKQKCSVIDKSNCNVSMLNILAVVNFRPCEYEGGIEGFLGNISIWDKQKFSGPWKRSASSYSSLMVRLEAHMTPELYQDLNERFPLSEFMNFPGPGVHVESTSRSNPLTTPTNFTAITSMQSEISSEGNKRRRLEPAAAIYRQDFSQARGKDTSIDGPGQFMSSVISDFTEGADNSSLDEIEQSWYSYGTVPGVTHRLGLERLCREDCHVLPDGTCFETDCRIIGIYPKPELIFIKPFKRTMKIAPFKVVLESADHRLSLEISTEEELCTFFEIEEVEAAIGTIPKLVSSMNMILRKHTNVVIEKRVKRLPSGYELPYWGLKSSLGSLLSS